MMKWWTEVPVDAKILILTEDHTTRSQLGQCLSRIQTRTLAIPNEPGGLRSHLTQTDLLILDTPQADTTEFGLLKQIRQLSTMPVILLVASDDYRVGIRGLDAGADCVMPKPPNERELLARIRALLRRVRPARTGNWQTMEQAACPGPASDIYRSPAWRAVD